MYWLQMMDPTPKMWDTGIAKRAQVISLSFFSEARTTEAAKVTKSCNVSTSRFRFENLYLGANVSLHTNVLKIVT